MSNTEPLFKIDAEIVLMVCNFEIAAIDAKLAQRKAERFKHYLDGLRPPRRSLRQWWNNEPVPTINVDEEYNRWYAELVMDTTWHTFEHYQFYIPRAVFIELGQLAEGALAANPAEPWMWVSTNGMRLLFDRLPFAPVRRARA